MSGKHKKQNNELKTRDERISGMASELLDVAGAAEVLGVSGGTVYRMARAGKIPSARLGKELRFVRAQVIQAVADGMQDNQIEKILKRGKVVGRRKR